MTRAARTTRTARWPSGGRTHAVALLGALVTTLSATSAAAVPGTYPAPDAPRPIDPQHYALPETMTWDDYRAIPGTRWNDTSRTGSIKNFRGALVLADYPDEPFTVSRPKNSTIFGNPVSAGDIPRDQVPQFYRDFLNTPGVLNHGHTINEYWMEDSGGRYGIDLNAFGPYRMPAKSHEYGVEPRFQGTTGCPAGETCGRDLRTDARAAWVAAVGERVAARYDFVFFLSAGQDESSTWQEFGPMKFGSPGRVPRRVGTTGSRAAELGEDTLRAAGPPGGPRPASGRTPRPAVPSRPRARGRASSRTSSATSSASRTTTTTRTRCRRDATTPGPGTCWAAGPSTAPAARTTAG